MRPGLMTLLDLLASRIRFGKGSPNGRVTGDVGDAYFDRAGGAGTVLYVKESGQRTNTGWVAK